MEQKKLLLLATVATIIGTLYIQKSGTTEAENAE